MGIMKIILRLQNGFLAQKPIGNSSIIIKQFLQQSIKAVLLSQYEGSNF